MNCEEVLAQLGEFLDPEARKELCEQIESHMLHCRDCKFEVDTLRKTILLYQSDVSTPVELPVPTAARLEQTLAREYEQGESAKAD